jgi:hypothetical protein
MPFESHIMSNSRGSSQFSCHYSTQWGLCDEDDGGGSAMDSVLTSTDDVSKSGP